MNTLELVGLIAVVFFVFVAIGVYMGWAQLDVSWPGKDDDDTL